MTKKSQSKQENNVEKCIKQIHSLFQNYIQNVIITNVNNTIFICVCQYRSTDYLQPFVVKILIIIILQSIQGRPLFYFGSGCCSICSFLCCDLYSDVCVFVVSLFFAMALSVCLRLKSLNYPLIYFAFHNMYKMPSVMLKQ